MFTREEVVDTAKKLLDDANEILVVSVGDQSMIVEVEASTISYIKAILALEEEIKHRKAEGLLKKIRRKKELTFTQGVLTGAVMAWLFALLGWSLHTGF